MFRRLLIANRGEIAIRIMRTAASLGIETVAVYSRDDAKSLHVLRADRAVELRGEGAAAYLDINSVVGAGLEQGCDALHPGYGFLSENADLARACISAGICFVGPRPESLEVFGDKGRARQLALDNAVPVLSGTTAATTLQETADFFDALEPDDQIILKAIAGGGGRGVRIVADKSHLADAFESSAREAAASFGNGSLYVEQYLSGARHIEVQVLGDGAGNVMSLGDRDCSLQRRHQKIVEIAPAPGLSPALRESLHEAAIKLSKAAGYQGAGTIEFLIDTMSERFFFIEANARLQVEHTITEEVTGVDIVAAQLGIASGRSLDEVLPARLESTGCAIQLRINMETMLPGGAVKPGGGEIQTFNPPGGPGIRLDTYAYAGYRSNPRFDSLLAKLILVQKDGDFRRLLATAYRSLCEFEISGIDTNISFLQNLLINNTVATAGFHTRFIDVHIDDLVAQKEHPKRYFTGVPAATKRAGAAIDHADPLAVLSYGTSTSSASDLPAEHDKSWILAPMQGTVIEVNVEAGDSVRADAVLVVMDAMKMEHEITTRFSGVVRKLNVAVGDTLYEGHPLVSIEEADVDTGDADEVTSIDLDYIRPDLYELVERRTTTLDIARGEAVAKRHDKGLRTARENIEDLCDPDSFVEYGQMVLAAQRRRRSIEELIEKSPADGMVTGVGSINGDLFEHPDDRCVVLSYDYTVFAGTQGGQNHRKTDRMIGVAERGKMPLVLFAEGGGGRPGDTDGIGGEGTVTFARFAQLSGLVPMVGITTGRCFAGNASLLGCCDVIIATQGSNIGMGGPAMIEGGGLGIYKPEEIGPMSVQVPNGVVDILVSNEAEAVKVAKQYLSYFQGRIKNFEENDQRAMRHVIPENRLRAYRVQRVVEILADVGTALELRSGFGHSTLTYLARVKGMPLGIIANNPGHLGGAIDSDGADKAARFMQLCDAFDIPILYFCDTPGIMVGPEVEKTALVRHSSRMFLTGANLSVPFFTVVLRKAYGLGAIAMAGGSYKTPFFTVAWPTGEFGGMGLEGSVKLGYRNELAAIADPEERRNRFDEMVAAAYRNGKALNYASLFSVDDTIDPADTRKWVAGMLNSVRSSGQRDGKKRAAIDAW